ncbi:MAG: hypothetical protein JSR45_05560 [Proteobacteria bacterium]|nr:hypothetical protein [Pseudomonadota bacterium]
MRLLRPTFAVLASTLALALIAGVAHAGDRGEMQKEDGFGDAVTSPLEDLNIKRKAIPAVLQRAVKDPYDIKAMKRCEPIAAEVGRLDAALGPDLDEAPPPDNRTRGQKLGSAAHGAAVAATRDQAHHLIPFRGWVRKLTGAERHDQAVEKAIRAGAIRRGYLKGVGMHMNCAPPAAPSWFVPDPHKARGGSWWDRFWGSIVAWFQSWWPF